MHEPPRPSAASYDGVETGPGAQRPAFGPIDPFCLLPVGAFLVMAVLFVVGGSVPIAAGFVVLAVLVALFDARVNRPAAASYRSGYDRAVSATPRQPVRQASRPPVQPPYRAPQANPGARPAPAISRQPHANRPTSGQPRSTSMLRHEPAPR